MASAYSPSDATISEGGKDESCGSLSDLELIAQKSEANRESGSSSDVELIAQDSDDYDADHAEGSRVAGAPQNAKRLVVKSKEYRVLGSSCPGESKLFKRKTRNSDTESDAVPLSISLSKPHTNSSQAVIEPSSPRLYRNDGKSNSDSVDAILAAVRNTYKLSNSYYRAVISPQANQWMGAMA